MVSLSVGKLYILLAGEEEMYVDDPAWKDRLDGFTKIGDVYAYSFAMFLTEKFENGIFAGNSYKFIFGEPFMVLEMIDRTLVSKTGKKEVCKIIQNVEDACNVGYINYYLDEVNLRSYKQFVVFERNENNG